MNDFINEQEYLAKIIECESKQDSTIEHEFIFIFKREAVKVANYLRSHGYEIVFKTRKPVGVILYYVGVPFESLKK